MTARANTSSGPKADPEPTGSHDESRPVAYAIVWGIAVGLLLLLIGLLSDYHDTFFNEIVPASLVGGTIVAFFVWRRERQTLFVRPHGPRVHSFESSYEHADARNLRPKDVWTPEPKHLVPFGPYGAGQWTAHPIGLVIVIGLVFMGLVSRTPLSDLMLFSLLVAPLSAFSCGYITGSQIRFVSSCGWRVGIRAQCLVCRETGKVPYQDFKWAVSAFVGTELIRRTNRNFRLLRCSLQSGEPNRATYGRGCVTRKNLRLSRTVMLNKGFCRRR